MKWVPDVAKLKRCFNWRFIIFSCGLFWNINSTAIWIVSCKSILVKRLQTSYETKTLSLLLTCCIYSQKLNESIALFTQFHSFTPLSYKIGLIRCLIHKAFNISSSYIIFHNELEKIKIFLQKNMYRISVLLMKLKPF